MKSYLIFILSILMTSNLFSHTEIEKELLNQLNLYRKKKGLETMSLNSKLSTVAFYHANYLAKCSSVGHVVHYDKLPHEVEVMMRSLSGSIPGKKFGLEPVAMMIFFASIVSSLSFPLIKIEFLDANEPQPL